MPLRIFITGGTIDDLEYDDPKDAPKNQASLIPGILKQAKVTLAYNIQQLMFKDSKFIDSRDRQLIAERCENCPEHRIIITHGTATMAQTAKYLLQKRLDKTIVLLGAAILANRADSDALFNLGTAFSAVQLLPAGVYIVMNGQIFTSDNVKKEKGVFQKKK